MAIDLERLSRTLSHALRHDPKQYGLTMDLQGWVQLDELVAALREHKEDWADLTEQDIRNMLDQADKQRYELSDEAIRALYGHSSRIRLELEPKQPPQYLYLGTTYRNWNRIMKTGIKPQGRRYVHLSAEESDAMEVALRATRNPCMLIILAEDAWNEGIEFYSATPKVWLTRSIPEQFVYELVDDEESSAEGGGEQSQADEA